MKKTNNRTLGAALFAPLALTLLMSAPFSQAIRVPFLRKLAMRTYFVAAATATAVGADYAVRANDPHYKESRDAFLDKVKASESYQNAGALGSSLYKEITTPLVDYAKQKRDNAYARYERNTALQQDKAVEQEQLDAAPVQCEQDKAVEPEQLDATPAQEQEVDTGWRNHIVSATNYSRQKLGDVSAYTVTCFGEIDAAAKSLWGKTVELAYTIKHKTIG